MLGKVFKAYDIREIYPKPLSEKLAWKIGYATAQYLTEQAADAGHDDPMMRHLVIGRDMRTSSPTLTDALTEGIRAFGAHVIDVGLVDTPFISFAINYLGCCGGIQTTASHNPANYNGFKISRIIAKPVGIGTGLDEICKYAALTNRDKVKPADGRWEQRDLWDAYRDHVLQMLDPELITGQKSVNVVIDASNGMAGTMVPKIFDGIKGIKITKLYFDNSTGEFVHEPNPLVESNLLQLQELVRETKADLGICFDGDADRCVVVDEQGKTIGCDHLTAWLAEGFLQHDPGASIVYDLRSTQSLPQIVEESGGKPIRSRVGHVFMKEKMAEHNAIFGGELSGHFYFRDNFYTDSGAMAFAAVLSALVQFGEPISTHMSRIKRYVQSGEINFQTEDKKEAIKGLKRAYPKARIDELDGVTIELKNWWCNVRSSNTEPLLRLNLEGPDEKTVEAKVVEVSKYLGERVAH